MVVNDATDITRTKIYLSSQFIEHKRTTTYFDGNPGLEPLFQNMHKNSKIRENTNTCIYSTSTQQNLESLLPKLRSVSTITINNTRNNTSRRHLQRVTHNKLIYRNNLQRIIS